VGSCFLKIFFFLIVLVLLNWGLMKLRPFKLLIFFLWLKALNFDDNFFWALLKKKKNWAFNFFFFGPIFFFGGALICRGP
jgi:hypothetical protein